MSTEKNIEIVKNAYACFNSGDVEGVLGLLSDDVSWITPAVEGAAFYGEKSGKDGALEFFQGLVSSESPDAFEQNDFIAQGDKVVVLGRWAATVNGTGNRWDSQLVHIFTIQDDKITAFREFFDNAAAGRAFRA